MNSVALNPCCCLRPILEVKRIFENGRSKIIRSFQCPYVSCGEKFYTNRLYNTHLDIKHICGSCWTLHENIDLHLCAPPQLGQGPASSDNANSVLQTGKFQISQSVYRGTILTFKHSFETLFSSFASVFEFLYSDIESILEQCIDIHKTIKVAFTIHTTLVEMNSDKKKDFPFYSPFQRIFHKDFIMSFVMSQSDYLISSLNIFSNGKSGMRLDRINYMEIRVSKYTAIRAKSYIPLPKEMNKKYFINIKCKDSLCLVYSVLAALKRDTIRLPDVPEL